MTSIDVANVGANPRKLDNFSKLAEIFNCMSFLHQKRLTSSIKIFAFESECNWPNHWDGKILEKLFIKLEQFADIWQKIEF